nr:hypothetical protein CFP56_11910 [Quercus suber]
MTVGREHTALVGGVIDCCLRACCGGGATASSTHSPASTRVLDEATQHVETASMRRLSIRGRSLLVGPDVCTCSLYIRTEDVLPATVP